MLSKAVKLVVNVLERYEHFLVPTMRRKLAYPGKTLYNISEYHTRNAPFIASPNAGNKIVPSSARVAIPGTVKVDQSLE